MYSFYKKYFLINLNSYPNISIDLEINVLLFYFLIGILAAIIFVNYKHAKTQDILKALTRHKAFCEESAKTLSELGIDTSAMRRMLNGEGQLAKTVARVGEKSYTYDEYIAETKKKGYKEEKIDFSSAKFFIRESRKDSAIKIVNTGNYSPLNTTLLCLFIVAIYICIALLMPAILSFINSLL